MDGGGGNLLELRFHDDDGGWSCVMVSCSTAVVGLAWLRQKVGAGLVQGQGALMVESVKGGGAMQGRSSQLPVLCCPTSNPLATIY